MEREVNISMVIKTKIVEKMDELKKGISLHSERTITKRSVALWRDNKVQKMERCENTGSGY